MSRKAGATNSLEGFLLKLTYKRLKSHIPAASVGALDEYPYKARSNFSKNHAKLRSECLTLQEKKEDLTGHLSKQKIL